MWNPLAFIGRWVRRRERDADRRILFPVIVSRGGVTPAALAALVMHVESDPAWAYPEEWRGEEPELYTLLAASRQ